MTGHNFDAHERTTPRSFSKQRRKFGNPIEVPKSHPNFEPPPFTNLVNLNLPLDIILPQIDEQLTQAGQILFHTVGDTGGVNDGGIV
jgi:hypothetical protein